MREITADVEELHQVIGVGNFEATGSTGSNTYDLAFRIVDSDWLAEHDRAVAEAAAKQALEDAADEVIRIIGQPAARNSTEQMYLRQWHADWLRARAASISTDKAGAGE